MSDPQWRPTRLTWRGTEWLGALTAALVVLTAALVALSFGLLAGPTPGQEPPPAPTLVVEARFDTVNPAGRLRLVQVVADFAPNTATPWYTPGGEGFVTVIEGAVSVLRDGSATTYQAGQSYVEQPGQLHAVSNPSSARARLLMAFLLPEGAPITTLRGAASDEELPPGPTTVARASFELVDQPAELEVVQRVVDFPVGVPAPAHVHPGPSVVTLLEGEVLLCMAGAEQRFVAGDTWLEPTGTPHSGVGGLALVRVAGTTLLPKGAPLLRLVGHCTDRPETSAGPAPAGLAMAP